MQDELVPLVPGTDVDALINVGVGGVTAVALVIALVVYVKLECFL